MHRAVGGTGLGAEQALLDSYTPLTRMSGGRSGPHEHQAKPWFWSPQCSCFKVCCRALLAESKGELGGRTCLLESDSAFWMAPGTLDHCLGFVAEPRLSPEAEFSLLLLLPCLAHYGKVQYLAFVPFHHRV